jgi:hypothetical protein
LRNQAQMRQNGLNKRYSPSHPDDFSGTTSLVGAFLGCGRLAPQGALARPYTFEEEGNA